MWPITPKEPATKNTPKKNAPPSVLIGALALVLSTVSATVLAQTCRTEIPLSTPDAQLIDNQNFTVSDNSTGLMWKQCSEGQANDDSCTGTATTHTWQQALSLAETMNAASGFAGYSDWRLPNIKELRSLVENACYGPSINSNRFPNTVSSHFWSASVIGDYAWHVHFSSGIAYYYGSYRNYSKQVRLVRGGQ